MQDGEHCFVHRPGFKPADIVKGKRAEAAARAKANKSSRREIVIGLFEEGRTAKEIAAALGVSEGTARWDIVCLRKEGRIGRRQTPLTCLVDEARKVEVERLWRDEQLAIWQIAERFGWTRAEAWNVISALRKQGFDLPRRKGELEVGADEKREVRKRIKSRKLAEREIGTDSGLSEATKPVLRVLGAAQRPLSAVEVHRFLNLFGEGVSKQAARNRLLKAEADGFAVRIKPETEQRRWFERGGGRWFVPLDAEQPRVNLTLADAERETELAALIESQKEELQRGDWIDSEKGHWADKSIDAPLTEDGFTILDTLGKEDQNLAELGAAA